VKPRFFADTRDLFKYDLVQVLMEGIPEIRHFLFVPMLTRGDGKDGKNHNLSKTRAAKILSRYASRYPALTQKG